MKANRLNLFWPVLIILVAVFWLLDAAGSLPLAIIDIATRAWPAVLILLGLSLLLGRRLRYGNLIAVGVCVLLVGGMTALAYNQQSSKPSSAYQVLDYEPKPSLGTDVTDVNINITALITQIDISPDPTNRVMTANFQGSSESRAALTFTQNGSVGNYNFTETQVSALPLLDSVGKGTLNIQLPAGVVIDQLTITGGDGDLTFDSSSNEIKALNIALGAGSITAKLSDKPGLIGDFKTGRGDVTVQIPQTIVAEIQLFGGGASNPIFNQNDYIITRDNVLKSQRNPTSSQMQLKIDTGGKITVQ